MQFSDEGIHIWGHCDENRDSSVFNGRERVRGPGLDEHKLTGFQALDLGAKSDVQQPAEDYEPLVALFMDMKGSLREGVRLQVPSAHHEGGHKATIRPLMPPSARSRR